jgi:hypothetical protein
MELACSLSVQPVRTGAEPSFRAVLLLQANVLVKVRLPDRAFCRWRNRSNLKLVQAECPVVQASSLNSARLLPSKRAEGPHLEAGHCLLRSRNSFRATALLRSSSLAA